MMNSEGKKQFVNDLKEGDSVDDVFAVSRIEGPFKYRQKDGLYFRLNLSDRTGDIPAIFWGSEKDEKGTRELLGGISIGNIVQITGGIVNKYGQKGELQLTISQGKGTLSDCNKFDPADFVRAISNDEIERLYSRLVQEIKTLKNEPLRQLIQLFFSNNEFVDKYKKSPSATRNHHNFVGGNLQHTVHVIELCKTTCDINGEIDRDLLICGALLHDVGKLMQYSVGLAISETDEGRYISHPVFGDRMLRDAIDKIGRSKFPKDLEVQLSHMILSHHGKIEWGSPVEPRTLEACVLHYADLMDSRVQDFIQRSSDK